MVSIMNSKYKLYILILAVTTGGTLTGLMRMCMPVLFKEISLDLNLSLVQIGTVWGLDPLAGVFASLFGGLLADRFGVKRTLIVVCFLAGIISILRGFSINFLTFASTMFLFGLVVSTTFVVVPKVTALWFNQKSLTLANSLITVFWFIGAMIGTMTSATVFSPLLGGWRNVIFLFSAFAFVLGILWITTGREPRKDEEPVSTFEKVPFSQALSKVVRIKEVWILGLIHTAFIASFMGLSGYLSLYLKNSGWNVAAADSVMTLQLGAVLVGAFPMILLVNKLKSKKGMLFFSLLATMAGVVVLPFVHGSAIYYVVFISGFLNSPSGALINTLIFELKGIGSHYGGTAVGLVFSIANLGAFVSPPIGNSLAQFGPGMPFIFWAILAAAGLPLILFLRKQDKVSIPKNHPDLNT
jgi:MFS family permease